MSEVEEIRTKLFSSSKQYTLDEALEDIVVLIHKFDGVNKILDERDFNGIKVRKIKDLINE